MNAIKMRHWLCALVVATFAVAAPVAAQCAGSYQKEPMFPDLVSLGPSSHGPSIDGFTFATAPHVRVMLSRQNGSRRLP